MKLALLFADLFATGGYPRDARWLAGALGRSGIDVTVFSRPVVPAKTDGLEQGVQFHTWKKLASTREDWDLVHVFGLFSLVHPLAAMACALKGRRVIISPLAHLLPLHMAVKRRKKELFLKTAWMPWINRVRAFHVFSEVEADSVRNWVPEAKFFVGTLGIFPCENACRVASISPENKAAREILFFGRNDVYQKGLDVLLNAYASTLKLLGDSAANQVKLTIAGQPWNDSTLFLEARLRQLGIEKAVTILGEVDESTKARLLTQTDYLIFLSRWDGPPRPIREAIAAGIPVIVTPETNMGELVTRFGAGLQVALRAEEVAGALLRAAVDENLMDRCRGGVEQLRKYLAWNRVAEDYAMGYEEALCKT